MAINVLTPAPSSPLLEALTGFQPDQLNDLVPSLAAILANAQAACGEADHEVKKKMLAGIGHAFQELDRGSALQRSP